MDMNNSLRAGQSTQKVALSQNESKRILNKYSIPTVEEIIAYNVDDAVKAAQKIGFPVVLKASGESLLHKTDQGLVFLNLSNPKEVIKAADSIIRQAGDQLYGLLIQPQLAGKREFVAGLFRDKDFGPLVMFGLGGIYTEAISDVIFRRAPLKHVDAAQMLDQIRAKALLGNFRGEKQVHREKLIQILISLSQIGIDEPDIAEIDINPLLITPDGNIFAVDSLIIPEKNSEKKVVDPCVDPKAIGSLFYPKSIAFVGASSQLGKWGQIMFTNVMSGEYEGQIYLVNPKGGTIAGHKVYTDITQIPGPVDLAVVTIPAKMVMNLIPQLAEKKIPNMLLISSGFGETGKKGEALQNELVNAAQDAGILILGPNTMGICNPHINLYCTGVIVRPIPGSTAVISQSGNMGVQLLSFAENQNIGIRAFSGSGNEAMIKIEDYMAGLETDDETRIIMLYIESIKNGSRFFETAYRVGKKKPIILLKGGQSSAGNRAASSHTGAIASDSKVFNSICRQAGIIKVEHSMELLDLSAAFSSVPLPKGNRVGIMTLGGGWGVVTADICSKYGLEVPELSNQIIQKIDKILPSYWSRSNPIDIVGEKDMSVPITIMEELMKWDQCDGVINLGILGRIVFAKRIADAIIKIEPDYSKDTLEYVIQAVSEFESEYIEHIVRLMEKYQKPIFGVSIMKDKNPQTVYRVKDSKFKGVFYETPESAVNAFVKMYEYQRFLATAD